MSEPRLFLDGRVILHAGDCREVLRGMADDTIDAVCTDPPYALVSIGKRFGKDGASPAKSNGATGVYARASKGFMGCRWDHGAVAFDHDLWAEVLRVMKPGAHGLAMGGTRTFHRLVCAIEAAGAMSVRIIKGDVRAILPTLEAYSFDCVVTSPPYYLLRDYGTATWEGGDAGCDHTGVAQRCDKPNDKQSTQKGSLSDRVSSECLHCGALRIDAQIGLEPTLDAYLETMVTVCRELRRVLKPTGVFFLNIGDSYAGHNAPGYRPGNESKNGGNSNKNGVGYIAGLKPKDLCLVPERLGIALQADGWWVRSHIIWHKLNPMPESVTDRPTSAHETIWMLTKSARYFWDAEAVKEDGGGRLDRSPGSHGRIGKQGWKSAPLENASGRNLRNVWSIGSQPFHGAHFATMAPEIAERCIKAGSPPGGRVLDPFAGAGTTGLVADRIGRDCTLIDLNTEYAEMAVNRIKNDAPLFAEVAAV